MLFFASCTSFERRMLFPGAATQGKATVQPGQRHEVLSLKTADGVQIAALFGSATTSSGAPLPNAVHCPTLIFFYGNAMCLAHCDFLFERFRRLGLNVIFPEYHGFGMSSGTTSEPALYAAANAALDHALHRPNIDPTKIIAGGLSLGGAVAIDLASRRPVAGLVTISTFTSVLDAAHHLQPWAPASLILRSRFDSLSKIGRVNCPILLIHGGDDALLPPAMTERLAQAATVKTIPKIIPGAGHNDVFEVGGEKLWQSIGDFAATMTKRGE